MKKALILSVVLAGTVFLFTGCGKKEAPKAKKTVVMIDAIRSSAEQGDVRSQYDLGVCYANGVGVEKNQLEAFNWWNKAANQGYAQAQCELGSCYEKGFGTVIFTPMANYWYIKAADQGYAAAQYAMGKCYTNGVGVAKSDYNALYWYAVAAMQGHVKAAGEVGIAYAQGKIVPFNREAAVYFLEHSRRHYPPAAEAWRELHAMKDGEMPQQ